MLWIWVGCLRLWDKKGFSNQNTCFFSWHHQALNSGIDSVDIKDQKTDAYRLDKKVKYPFYLRIFFDLIDVTPVNSHIVYAKLGKNISLLNFKIVVEKALIGRCTNCKRFFLTSRLIKRTMNHPCPEKSQPTCPSSKRSEWNAIIARMKGKITNVWLVTCALCLTKERKCFLKHDC